MQIETKDEQCHLAKEEPPHFFERINVKGSGFNREKKA
jgi:hypothetical protein